MTKYTINMDMISELNQVFLVFPIWNILTDESPPAMATCSLSGEKSTAKTPRVRPVTVPEK